MEEQSGLCSPYVTFFKGNRTFLSLLKDCKVCVRLLVNVVVELRQTFGLFRADYSKHVSSLRGLDGPFCHSVSRPNVQILLCTMLHYEINKYGYIFIFLVDLSFFFISKVNNRVEINAIN